MTKKDFQLIADAVLEAGKNFTLASREPVTTEHIEAIEFVALTLARKLKESNPRFDSERFLKACGVSEERVNQ